MLSLPSGRRSRRWTAFHLCSAGSSWTTLVLRRLLRSGRPSRTILSGSGPHPPAVAGLVEEAGSPPTWLLRALPLPTTTRASRGSWPRRPRRLGGPSLGHRARGRPKPRPLTRPPRHRRAAAAGAERGPSSRRGGEGCSALVVGARGQWGQCSSSVGVGGCPAARRPPCSTWGGSATLCGVVSSWARGWGIGAGIVPVATDSETAPAVGAMGTDGYLKRGRPGSPGSAPRSPTDGEPSS